MTDSNPNTELVAELAESLESATEGENFNSLGLPGRLLEAVARVGYTTPTAIQSQAIPPLLGKRDLVGLAQTGTGKTAAFALPLLAAVDLQVKKIQALVLAPTRELALQVSDAIETYGSGLGGLRHVTVYGGAPIHQQLARLDRGVHVVVGTPGRIMDCMRRGAMDLSDLRMLVLDEADEMLRMGFIEDIEWIVQQTPKRRQTALFSATMAREIERVAQTYLDNPVRVEVKRSTKTVANIKQFVLITRRQEKYGALVRILDTAASKAVLVFARTKIGCDQLAASLVADGFSAAALHGDMSQNHRQEVVRRMKSGRTQLVVATDVAARGLDIEDITHVINYDPPGEPDTYVHRIGRTGRAGRDGTSILMLTPQERRRLVFIERHTRQKMQPFPLPTNRDLEEVRARLFKQAVEDLLQHREHALGPYRRVAEELAEAHSAQDVAAAIAMMATRHRPLTVSGPEPRLFDIDPRKNKQRRDNRPVHPYHQQPSQHRDAPPAQRDSHWPQRDARPPQRDARPPQRDARPPQRDARPPQHDARPPQRDARPAHPAHQGPPPQHADQAIGERPTRPAQSPSHPPAVRPAAPMAAAPAHSDNERRPRHERPNRPSAGQVRADRKQRQQRRRDDIARTRLFISLGKRAGLRPSDLVGAVTNEAGIDGGAIGAIDIGEKFSFFDVATEDVPRVLDRMGHTNIRGRKCGVRVAIPEGEGPPQRVVPARHQKHGGAPDKRERKGSRNSSGDRPPKRKTSSRGSVSGDAPPKRRPVARRGGPKKHIRSRG